VRLLHIARAVLGTPSARLALAGMALSFGVKTLIDMVGELRDDVAALTAELAQANLQAGRQGTPYPAPDDLDPLRNGRPEHDVRPLLDEFTTNEAALAVDDLGDR
jgi:hypothetical protein